MKVIWKSPRKDISCVLDSCCDFCVRKHKMISAIQGPAGALTGDSCLLITKNHVTKTMVYFLAVTQSASHHLNSPNTFLYTTSITQSWSPFSPELLLVA